MGLKILANAAATVGLEVSGSPNAATCTIQIACTGGTVTLTPRGGNIGGSLVDLPLDDGSTSVTIADGGSELIEIDMPLALVGIYVNQIANSPVISVVLCSTGV